MYNRIHFVSTVILPLITMTVANLAGRQSQARIAGNFEQPIVLIYFFAQLAFIFIHLVCLCLYKKL